MRGSVKQQSSGSWRIVYDVPDPSGKRKQKAETIRGTKKEAEKVLRERIAAVENGGYVPKHKETVAQFLGDWLSTYVTTNTRPRTQETYRGVLNRYVIPAIGALQIQKLSGRHIQAIYADMAQRGLSSRTIKQTHVVLKGALAYGVKQGIMAQNVASTATAPRPEHREESEMWDSSTINRFLEAAKDNRFLPVYHLAILTGMRRAELCGLKWVSVDLIKGRLIVVNTLNRVGGKGLIDGEPKTPRSRRSITLSPEAISLLHEVRGRQIASQAALNGIWQGSGYVFTQADGSPIEPRTVTENFSKLVLEAGLPHLTLHGLRHAHATILLANGLPDLAVSRRLGHSNISTTLDTYGHIIPGLEELAALRIDKILAGD